ncbi:MAG: aminotransferase class V-fold PLP-dependent enzyme [Planctomycetota bacterium]
MAGLDRRRFLKGGAIAGLGPLAACRATFDRRLAAVSLGRSPEQLRDLYTIDADVAYLNHGSIGTIPRIVQEARTRYLETCERNPWLYMWGGAWDDAREQVRAAAARVLGAGPADVAITHNTTEGCNVLARGLPLKQGDEVLFSTLNHPGASICWRHAAESSGYRVRQFEFPVADVASLSVADVVQLHVEAITDDTRVLVVPHIDNMVGLRHPLRELARAAKARGVRWVVVDAAQTLGMIPVNFAEAGVDALCASPHKWLQAPKGLGLFCATPELREVLRPFWVTWGQQRWAGTARVFEDYGTRNLPELLSLEDAIAFRETLGIAASADRLRDMHEGIRARVDASELLEWRSPRDWRLGGSLFALHVRGSAAPPLGVRLWQQHQVVVRAFGGELDTLRISPNVHTTPAEIDRLFAAVEAPA